MSGAYPRCEWQGHGFFDQKCACCGFGGEPLTKENREMDRLFVAWSYMNGDDEYTIDLCRPCKSSFGKLVVEHLDRTRYEHWEWNRKMNELDKKQSGGIQ
jgi:hypothetical protein